MIMVYNFRQLMSIFSIKKLKSRLKSLALTIIAIYEFILLVLSNNKLHPINLELK